MIKPKIGKLLKLYRENKKKVEEKSTLEEIIEMIHNQNTHYENLDENDLNEVNEHGFNKKTE
jgi:hypothetical protein